LLENQQPTPQPQFKPGAGSSELSTDPKQY